MNDLTKATTNDLAAEFVKLSEIINTAIPRVEKLRAEVERRSEAEVRTSLAVIEKQLAKLTR